MSILNLQESLKNLGMNKVEIAKTSDEEISGVHNTIKNFVEAKKGMANQEDKGKKRSILVSAVKSIFKGKKA